MTNIYSYINVNKPLLGKWLWRLGTSWTGLWRRLIVDKYKLVNTGQLVPFANYRASGMWKSILSVKDDFEKCTHYWAHGGQKIGFWNDLLYGNTTFRVLFPRLQLLDRRQGPAIDSNYQLVGGRLVWELSLQRNLLDKEAAEMIDHLSMFEKVFLTLARGDEGMWGLDLKVYFW